MNEGKQQRKPSSNCAHHKCTDIQCFASIYPLSTLALVLILHHGDIPPPSPGPSHFISLGLVVPGTQPTPSEREATGTGEVVGSLRLTCNSVDVAVVAARSPLPAAAHVLHVLHVDLNDAHS